MNNSDSMSDSGSQEETFFEAARKLGDAAKRKAFLDLACADDPRMRDRIEALFAAEEKANEFFGAKGARTSCPPAGESASTRGQDVRAPEKTIRISETVITEGPGTTIGRYKLREKIGEGGCGVVYVAEQEQPVRRRVALKIIKPGMDTRSVVARFEAERQALAMMDHPNIAKVLDAGTTDTGRPYFVMELVRGIRITEYCDQNKLATRDRLDLFSKVCQAVQHAHQKGIIHRDLKPSNILVTLHDGVPVPKVIDFGIAKATEGRLTDLTVYTELHHFIGTPAYMSPEQAEMSGLDIDTRSDIYSLGVLLYELLTGKTPFDPKELIESGIDEMRRTIREREPIRPSTRLNTLQGAELTMTAQRHGADVPKLAHLLRGDLDWIVMKALEKDRTRRFATANDLAADIQRYLSNEPVVARPPSTLYRFQKLVRRNKAIFAGVGAVATALVLGFGLSLYLFIQERHALGRAVAAEKEQQRLRQEAEAGREFEASMRQRAEAGKVYADAGLLLAQRKWGEAERLVRSVPANPSSASIYSVLGIVHMSNMEWGKAATNYWTVVRLVPTDHNAYHYLAPLLLQKGDVEGYRRLCAEMLRQFGNTSDPAIAERTAKDCSIIAPVTADLPTISKLAETAVAAGPEHQYFASFQFAKGLAEFRQGRFAGAVEWLQPVTAKADDPYRTVQAYMVLAMAQYQLGQIAPARATLTKGLDIAEGRLPKEDNFTAEYRSNDWIIAHFLMREAEALVQPDSTRTPKLR